MIIAEASEHAVQISLLEELMEKGDYRGAVSEAQRVLDNLEPTLPTLARAARTRGRALMAQAEEDTACHFFESGDLPLPVPVRGAFADVREAYELAKKLDPTCRRTQGELDVVSTFLRQLPPPAPPEQVESADVDVLVVGAGAAGIGCAMMLTETFGLEKSRVLLVERGEEVGESFRRWPAEMRFISPSFNQQGWTDTFDLNAISKGTSPAYSLHSEHPSGAEYASYLSAIVETNKLHVRKLTEVVSVRDIGAAKELPLFAVDVRSVPSHEEKDVSPEPTTETLSARYIVWAAGEFQYPRNTSTTKERKEGEEKKRDEEKKGTKESMEGEEKKSDMGEERKKKMEIPGSELCLHNSQVRSWAEIPGDEFIIIGGYESGVDAAINLARANKQCRVLASTPCWSTKTPDPSAELAPYTAARLRDVTAPGFPSPPELLAPLRVVRVERSETGGFDVTAEWKPTKGARAPVTAAPSQQPTVEGSTVVWHTPQAPILCTGFEGSVAAAAGHLFAFADDDKDGCLHGAPLLTEEDESTEVPGVFLVGPSVSHGSLSFCFVYKFRQRFAVVAGAICRGLGIDTRASVAECRKANMFLDEFSCCEDTCGDVC